MNLTDPIFTDETKAREHFEATRWPNGPYCPHCGETERVYRVHGKTENTRPGLLFCNGCNQPFSVTVGTVMERSHVPLNKWALAFRLMCSSKKGVSAHQLHRVLGVTYKTAWFMAHRIREAMRPNSAGNRKNHVPPKEAVVALVERDGRVRSRHVANVDGANLRPILKAEIDTASYVMTDESPIYPGATRRFAGHGTVNHSIEEYVRGSFWHTNTVENYFSILKRGVIGTYHHVSAEHLKRYLGEFDFRHNERVGLGVNDTERTAKAIRGATGKRLTYQRTRGGRDEEIPF